MPTHTYRALSLKQPWAALLAAGRKTIEVRRWRTDYRGPLLIHAARVPDPRPEGWAHVSPDLEQLARLGGGIVGVGTLTGCRFYRRADEFTREQAAHLNEPAWFEPAGLFGFCFEGLRVLPYHRVPGNLRLFEVELDVALDLPPAAAAEAGWQRFWRLVRSLGGSGSE